MKFLFIGFLLYTCSMPEVSALKVPRYIMRPNQGNFPENLDEYTKAAELISKYANSDEFYAFVIKKRNKYSHTSLTISEAIAKFRQDLDRRDDIYIEVNNSYQWPEGGIGGWDGKIIKQNPKYKLPIARRAGHLIHETAHKYGYDHPVGFPDEHDNISSLPYSMGYDLEEFITMKEGK